MTKELTNLMQRTTRFVLACQLDGLCDGLRFAIAHEAKPGLTTVNVIRKLARDIREMTPPFCCQDLPEVHDETSPADLLAYAEMLRATVSAFLQPDESSERISAMGFFTGAGKPA